MVRGMEVASSSRLGWFLAMTRRNIFLSSPCRESSSSWNLSALPLARRYLELEEMSSQGLRRGVPQDFRCVLRLSGRLKVLPRYYTTKLTSLITFFKRWWTFATSCCRQ